MTARDGIKGFSVACVVCDICGVEPEFWARDYAESEAALCDMATALGEDAAVALGGRP